ncbi:hypothetical protein TWF694_008173 [Orbilia ellipsospora]|uniref:Uncharacterized protein n=1 Tax=Orbilia ellipsospora TaxID=2528407 RepID=A0AAV9XLZ0_9PEZI
MKLPNISVVGSSLFLAHIASGQDIRVLNQQQFDALLEVPPVDHLYATMERLLIGWRTTYRIGSDFNRAEDLGEYDREELEEIAHDSGNVVDYSGLHQVYRPVDLAQYPSYDDRANAVVVNIKLLARKIKDAEDSALGAEAQEDMWDFSEEDDDDTVYGRLSTLRWSVEGWYEIEYADAYPDFYNSWERESMRVQRVKVIGHLDDFVNMVAEEGWAENSWHFVDDWIFGGREDTSRQQGYHLNFDSANALVEGINNLGEKLFKLRRELIDEWKDVLELLSPGWTADPLVAQVQEEIAGLVTFWGFYQKIMVEMSRDISEIMWYARSV